MKLAGLVASIIVTGIGSYSVAQVAVRPKPAPVAPKIAPRPAAPTLNRAMEAARGTGAATGVGAAVVQATEKGALTCNVTDFSEKLSAGTRFSASDAAYVVGQGLISLGTCGGPEGVTGYAVDARENLLDAAMSVSQNLLRGRKATELSAAELAQMDLAWGKGLMEAKNRKANADQQVTLDSQVVVARQIKENCNLRSH